MQQKKFSRLTDNQKVKVQKNINEAVERIIRLINFNEYLQNEDKKANVFNNTVDIYYYQHSNIITKESYKDNLKAMLQSISPESYSNKI